MVDTRLVLVLVTLLCLDGARACTPLRGHCARAGLGRTGDWCDRRIAYLRACSVHVLGKLSGGGGYNVGGVIFCGYGWSCGCDGSNLYGTLLIRPRGTRLHHAKHTA
jgi:hypothetical protein